MKCFRDKENIEAAGWDGEEPRGWLGDGRSSDVRLTAEGRNARSAVGPGRGERNVQSSTSCATWSGARPDDVRPSEPSVPRPGRVRRQ